MAAGALTWIGTHQPHFVSGRVDFGKASGELFSLGYGGMLVRSSFGLSKGTELHVRFVVLGYGGCFEAEGRVVGTDLDVLAIMFLTRSPELLDLLQSMNAVAGVPDYDFSEFVASVLELELNQMIHCVDREIEEIGKVRFENSARRIRRQIYESELNRLRFFFEDGSHPETNHAARTGVLQAAFHPTRSQGSCLSGISGTPRTLRVPLCNSAAASLKSESLQ